jgi:hypothetical protein
MKLKKSGTMDLLVVDQMLLLIPPKESSILTILKTLGQVDFKIVVEKEFYVLKNVEMLDLMLWMLNFIMILFIEVVDKLSLLLEGLCMLLKLQLKLDYLNQFS